MYVCAEFWLVEERLKIPRVQEKTFKKACRPTNKGVIYFFLFSGQVWSHKILKTIISNKKEKPWSQCSEPLTRQSFR